MKCYVTERQLRLAGKAWEIREWLRQQRRTAGDHTAICDLLARQTKHLPGSVRQPELKVV